MTNATRISYINGFWIVEVASPVSKRGWIIQGEWRTEAEAIADAANWE